MPLIAFEDALEETLAHAERLGVEHVPLDEAAGRVLAAPMLADRPLPEFDHSAMDGYALDSVSLRGEGPWDLLVAGESRAGGTRPCAAQDATFRIFTGAALPFGVDSVVMQEAVVRTGDRLTLPPHAKPRAGQNIRLRGEDLAEGAVALRPGTRLHPAMLGLAAALDRTTLDVARKPRLAILATGDELRAPGSPPRFGSIPESNVHAIAGLARRVGAEPHALPYASDSKGALLAALEQALDACDLLVTIGGASVGDHDLVRPALEALGARFRFTGVAMRPGKPTAFATLGHTRILCLAGNPASAMVAFHLFGVPLLRALQGDRDARPRSIALPVLGHHARNLGGRTDGRDDFLRAELAVHDGQLRAKLAARQVSGSVTSLAHANALIWLGGTRERIDEGDHLPTFLLSELGG